MTSGWDIPTKGLWGRLSQQLIKLRTRGMDKPRVDDLADLTRLSGVLVPDEALEKSPAEGGRYWEGNTDAAVRRVEILLECAIDFAYGGSGPSQEFDPKWAETARLWFGLDPRTRDKSQGERHEFAAGPVGLQTGSMENHGARRIKNALAQALVARYEARQPFSLKEATVFLASTPPEEPRQDAMASTPPDAAPRDEDIADIERPAVSPRSPAPRRSARRPVLVGIVVAVAVAVVAVLVGSLIDGGSDGSDPVSQAAGSCPAATTVGKALEEWNVAAGAAGAVLFVAAPKDAGSLSADGWEDQIDGINYGPGSEREYALAFINNGSTTQTNPIARVTLPSAMSPVSSPTCIYGKRGLALGDRVGPSSLMGRAGLTLPSVDPYSFVTVTFSAQLADAGDLPCGETNASVYARIDSDQDVEGEPVATARLWGDIINQC